MNWGSGTYSKLAGDLGRPEPPSGLGKKGGDVRAAVATVTRPEHLRRTLGIAFVVGIALTAINQADVILGGDATLGTWVKCGMNFCVPFVVSNLGLLAGRRPQ
jgi:hypothetical protein